MGKVSTAILSVVGNFLPPSQQKAGFKLLAEAYSPS